MKIPNTLKTNSMPLLPAAVAALAMTMIGYSLSPPKVTVRRPTTPLGLRWRDAAMLAAILLSCAASSPAVASAPVIKPSSSFNSQTVFVGARATFKITATGDAPLAYQWRRGTFVHYYSRQRGTPCHLLRDCEPGRLG